MSVIRLITIALVIFLILYTVYRFFSSSNSPVTSHSITTHTSIQVYSNRLEETKTRSTAIVSPSKPFFGYVGKLVGDEFTKNYPAYRIPPRIQQVFIENHEYIFDNYRQLIQTILKMHPAFEHWFWFQKEALSFACQSHFLEIFLMAHSKILKSDILRYFVIYEFGGVYLDMDFKAYAPLDPLLKNYSCILGRQPDPMAYSRLGRQYLISNAFFAMRPHHPFLHLITDRIRAKTSFGTDESTETGPEFMSDLLVEFAALENCTLPTPDVINNNEAVVHLCGDCVLLPWHWVIPEMDGEAAADGYKRKCAYY